MENIYAFDLNLPCKFLNENWDYRSIKNLHTKVNIETAMHVEAINFFKLINLRITSTEVFCRKPYNEWANVHIDNHDNFDRARINYLIEDSFITPQLYPARPILHIHFNLIQRIQR